MYQPQPGDILSRDGQDIEIDFVEGGQVYYWLFVVGPLRMPIDQFVAQVEAERPTIITAAERSQAGEGSNDV